jgi:hypothetical protein
MYFFGMTHFLRRRSCRFVAGVAATSIVVYGMLLGVLGSASAGPGPPNIVDFSRLHVHPVAGHVFEGLAIINRTGLNGGTPERFIKVRCDAEVGGKRLRATQLVYGKPRSDGVQVVVCGWHIPADGVGKILRLWTYRTPAGYLPHEAQVNTQTAYVGSPEYSWRVMKP